jgi:hypothetical protein
MLSVYSMSYCYSIFMYMRFCIWRWTVPTWPERNVCLTLSNLPCSVGELITHPLLSSSSTLCHTSAIYLPLIRCLVVQIISVSSLSWKRIAGTKIASFLHIGYYRQDFTQLDHDTTVLLYFSVFNVPLLSLRDVFRFAKRPGRSHSAALFFRGYHHAACSFLHLSWY